MSRSFGDTRALVSASLALGAGEIVAVTGPSGSGKSTLLHCLAGILVPDSGTVELDGRRLDLMDDEQRTALRRRELGFVFQFGQLVPELSAAENVALPLLLGEHDRRSALSAAHAWLARLGLDGLGGRRPGQLSGGQAQRVAVARALAHHPRVVFADEPTGSLDSQAGEGVLDALTGAAREEGVAVLLVTHDHHVAARADRVVTVTDGVLHDPEPEPVGAAR